jgi:hypothetical protein
MSVGFQGMGPMAEAPFRTGSLGVEISGIQLVMVGGLKVRVLSTSQDGTPAAAQEHLWRRASSMQRSMSYLVATQKEVV